MLYLKTIFRSKERVELHFPIFIIEVEYIKNTYNRVKNERNIAPIE